MKRKPKKHRPVYSDEPGIAELIAYYDSLKGVDLVEEGIHESLPEPTSWLQVPAELVPEFRKKIERYMKKSRLSA